MPSFRDLVEHTDYKVLSKKAQEASHAAKDSKTHFAAHQAHLEAAKKAPDDWAHDYHSERANEHYESSRGRN